MLKIPIPKQMRDEIEEHARENAWDAYEGLLHIVDSTDYDFDQALSIFETARSQHAASQKTDRMPKTLTGVLCDLESELSRLSHIRRARLELWVKRAHTKRDCYSNDARALNVTIGAYMASLSSARKRLRAMVNRRDSGVYSKDALHAWIDANMYAQTPKNKG